MALLWLDWLNSVLPVKCTLSEISFFFLFFFLTFRLWQKAWSWESVYSIIVQESSIQASVVHRAGQRLPHTRKPNIIKQHKRNKNFKLGQLTLTSSFHWSLQLESKYVVNLLENGKEKKLEKCHNQGVNTGKTVAIVSHTHTQRLLVQL